MLHTYIDLRVGSVRGIHCYPSDPLELRPLIINALRGFYVIFFVELNSAFAAEH